MFVHVNNADVTKLSIECESNYSLGHTQLKSFPLKCI